MKVLVLLISQIKAMSSLYKRQAILLKVFTILYLDQNYKIKPK